MRTHCTSLHWWAAASLIGLTFLGPGCSSTPPPPPPPLSVQEAQHAAGEAARWMEAGQWQPAADAWKRAGERYALLNDLPGRAVALHNQGQALRRLRRPDEAAAAFEEAAQINQSQGRQRDWWGNQMALLQLESDRGQTNALDLRLAALTPKLASVTDARLQAVFHNELGLRQMAQSELDAAEASFRQAQLGFEKAKDQSGLAVVMGNRAGLAERRAQLDGALDGWRSALHLYETLGDTPGIAQALEGQGRVLLAMPERQPEAEELLRRALRNYTLLRMPEAAARTEALLSQALQRQGKRDAAEGARPGPQSGAQP